jgi:hypothetical protein
MNPNPVRSANSGPGSLRQLQENWGNRPIPYLRISNCLLIAHPGAIPPGPKFKK